MDLRQIFREMAEGDFFSPPKLLQPQRSDLTSDFKSVTSITYIHIHVHIAYMFWTHFEGFLEASEATTASKQPRRSDLTSYLKSVTSITYISMCILLIWYGPF